MALHRASAVRDSRRHRGQEAAGGSAEGTDYRRCSLRNLGEEAGDGHNREEEEDHRSPEVEEGRHSAEGRHTVEEEEGRRILLGEDRSLEEVAGQAIRSRSRIGCRGGVGSRSGPVRGIQTCSAMRIGRFRDAQVMKAMQTLIVKGRR